ncbi:MAG: AI-2E family transporter, partial [Proteobacteria bacterium]|nr:AI-2E family transporter [Pseudomonadota bacterium]
MANPVIKANASRILITVAAFVVVVAGMRAGADIIVPFLLALFIAIICAPALDSLERLGLPRAAAMIVVVAAIVAFGIGITGLVGSSLNRFTASLPEYTQRLNDYTHAVEDWLNNRGVPFDARELRNLMDASRVMRLAADIFNSFGGVLTNAFLIFLTVVFILFEMGSFAIKLRAVVDDPD